MLELKPYLVGILRSLEKDYEVEDVMFEATDDGYRITFKTETTEDKDNKSDIKGDWYRNTEITINLGTKYFEAWEYSRWGGFCSCKNCCEEEKEKEEKSDD